MATHKITLPKGTIVPNHIALIPDGNRRWARSRGLKTISGHKKGFERAIELGRSARELGIHTVTIWGFSTENWNRAKSEINYLMKLYGKLIDDFLKEALSNKVKIVHIGRKDRMPKYLMNKIAKAEKATTKNDKYIINLALDYGGHDEIVRAVKKIMVDNIAPTDVTIKIFEKYFDMSDQPYPYVDLIIRTSGEQRTSGFLLWGANYAETYWEYDHFPDFTPDKLRLAMIDYSRRRRRFGGNDKEKHLKFRPEVSAKLELAWWRLQNIPKGTRLRDYALMHLKEQYGLSKELSKQAAKYFAQGILEGKRNKWGKSKTAMVSFYKLIKEEVKLAFEPSLAASLQIKLWKEMDNEKEFETTNSENTTQELYAEVYRISLFQAAKLAHLRVLAKVERNLALQGMGNHHWRKAEDYLEKFYVALKERVA